MVVLTLKTVFFQFECLLLQYSHMLGLHSEVSITFEAGAEQAKVGGCSRSF